MSFRSKYIGVALLLSIVAQPNVYAVTSKRIEGGNFVPQYGVGSSSEKVRIKTFLLDETPVTNEAFELFLKRHAEWLPSSSSPLMTDKHYLKHWVADAAGIHPSFSEKRSAIVNISWYAAHAYCASVGKRLPTVFEWEYAAAASDAKQDASHDPKFVQTLLDWYSHPPSTHESAFAIKHGKPNFYGVYDLHGLIWEWTQDFNSVFVAGDNRRDAEELGNLFCGSATASSTDRANYAAYMRYALRNSLHANYTMENLGFRCAKEI